MEASKSGLRLYLEVLLCLNLVIEYGILVLESDASSSPCTLDLMTRHVLHVR